MGVFAALAVVLALVGLYAVMSYLVTQRVREIGVRMALGATRADVLRLTLWHAGRLSAIGLGLGVVLGVAAGRAVEGVLFGTVAASVPLLAGLTLALGVTALVASLIPARQAARVDPALALRAE